MTKLFVVVLGCLAASASLLAQSPVITSVQNPASNILPGLPNYGIAEGSIFVVYGTGMGPGGIQLAPSLPYLTTLAGTSVKIISGGTTYNAYMVYTLSSQVAAVLPSGVPAGSATVQVTYNTITSSAFPTTILQSDFGISTVNQTGTGAAVITTGTYAVITNTNSAAPGGTYTMWGTGLGPDAASDNNVAPGAISTPITVYVGGVQANVTYSGRSSGVALDQINFTIPAGLSGCEVSLVVEANNTLVSNTTTIPIAANGGTCSDSIGLPSTTWAPLLALSGGVNLSYISLSQTAATTFPPPANTAVTSVSTKAAADFAHFSPSQLASEYQGLFNIDVSLGSCVITIGNGNNSGNTVYTPLDAGTSLTLTPPTGSPITLASQGTGAYQTNGTTALPSGTYTVANGTGGANVGAINVSFAVAPAVTWSNETTLGGSTVTRANGMTFTWTGGNASSNGYVDIQGSAPFGSNNYSVNFECAVPVSAGTFTVPPAVLLALPAGFGGVQLGTNVGELVTVPGMNLGVVSASSTASTLMTWK